MLLQAQMVHQLLPEELRDELLANSYFSYAIEGPSSRLNELLQQPDLLCNDHVDCSTSGRFLYDLKHRGTEQQIPVEVVLEDGDMELLGQEVLLTASILQVQCAQPCSSPATSGTYPEWALYVQLFKRLVVTGSCFVVAVLQASGARVPLGDVGRLIGKCVGVVAADADWLFRVEPQGGSDAQQLRLELAEGCDPTRGLWLHPYSFTVRDQQGAQSWLPKCLEHARLPGVPFPRSCMQ